MSEDRLMACRTKFRNEYCFVPKCGSTRVSTPNKIFVNVPDKPELRRKWLLAARRDLQSMPLSVKSHLRCCEDHFNLEEDAENYMRWKMMGGQLRIKKGVLPHIFKCQARPSDVPSAMRAVIKKRERLRLLSDSFHQENINAEENSEPACHPEVGSDCENMPLPLHEITTNDYCKMDKGVQVRLPFRSKGTQTSGSRGNDVGTSPIKVSQISPIKNPNLSEEGSTCSSDDGCSDLSVSMSSLCSDDFMDSEEEVKQVREESFKALCFFMERDPKLYLGISPTSYTVLSILCNRVKATQKNVMLCLKKIKLNDQIKILGNEFGMHFSTVSRNLRETMPKLASCMTDLIYWPENESRLRTLPTAFIANYSNVSCIIDCLEIAIEKPSDSLHQALSWSQYKKANTIKYLISCLPSGFINYISEGYLGRATDEAISINCGFMDKMPQGSTVMADRGFKNLGSALARRSCSLVRPPSVATGQMLSQNDVRLTKQVASLRIHVERVIGRLRDFAILKPTAVLDHSLISMSDEVMIIACGLVNLDKQITKA